MSNPKRAHVLTLELGADTKDDMIAGLEQIIFDLHRGSTQVTSGGYSTGWIMSYTVDPDMTHDRYFELLNAALEAKEL